MENLREQITEEKLNEIIEKRKKRIWKKSFAKSKF